ncbi:MAG: MFS transporter [Reyranella sp.]|jgi:MFS family permease|nr:MFS transporter [Reyranella sp.]
MAEAAAAQSVESRASWRAAWITLGILSISFGSPLLIVVGMKPMQEALGIERAVVALAGALVWVGTGAGGILMGWLADRIGLRTTVAIGACMIAGGLALSSTGSIWALYVGQGLMVGFLGGGGVYPPLLVYVSRWFDRRRGTAIALISSGQYVAGVAWPALFERGISTVGWQLVMLGYAAVVLAVILPAVMFLRPPPTAPAPPRHAATIAADGRRRIAGLHPNVVQALLCVAAFFCCIPMSVPSAHLVAFCSDIGISPTRSAVMLSVMLAAAFLARQAWGALADRIGGLRTILAGSICQAVAISLFLTTQDEAGLFAISAAFGLGFAGIIPAYSVAIRDLFPSSEASWRMPLTLFTAMSGMAFGSWFAGYLYDHFAYYAPAFGIGVAFNIANLCIIGFLVFRTGGLRHRPVWPVAA